jgi:hypothetical protein
MSHCVFIMSIKKLIKRKKKKMIFNRGGLKEKKEGD